MADNGNYRLVALDMDGTLLNTAHETTARTRDVLSRAARAGKLVALSTGRCLSELREHLASIPGIAYVIGENGASVYEAASLRMIHHVAMDDADAARVFEAANRFDVVRQSFVDNQSYMQCRFDDSLKPYHIHDFVGVFRAGSIAVDDLAALCRERRGHVEKINLYFRSQADRAAFREMAAGSGVVISDSIGIGYEISPAAATKARGLAALCDHLGIPIEQSMAVGDGGNDIDIMKVAGLSVAMANAIDEVRTLADVITGDCDHDGAAEAIEKYMLDDE